MEFMDVSFIPKAEAMYDYEEKINSVVPFLTNNARVLSIGIGGGLELETLDNIARKNNLKLDLFGLDLSDRVVSQGKEYLHSRNVDVKLFQGSALDIPFQKTGIMIDVILMSSMLHEV